MKAIMVAMMMVTACAGARFKPEQLTEEKRADGSTFVTYTYAREDLIETNHVIYDDPPALVHEGGACKLVRQCSFGLDCVDNLCRRKAR